jgi:hypothetical protein
MNIILVLAIAFFAQEETPFKPSEEFELSMDYDLRTRPVPENYKIDFEDRRKGIGPLPFLGLTLKVLQTRPGEERIRITDNYKDVVASKKIKPGFEFSFELGFTADMKDRVKAHEYTILFQTPDRKENISRIVIHVAEDGTFLVNNEVRGRL